MQIEISDVITENINSQSSNLTFPQSEKIRGKIKIDFCNKGYIESFCENNVNIPMFLADTKLFLDITVGTGKGVWRICFSPFVDGLMEGNNLVITRDTPVGKKVLEVLTNTQRIELIKCLDNYFNTYGRLEPSR